MRGKWLAVLFLLFSCSPSSSMDFMVEGEGLIKSLIEELKQMETKEDLLASQYRIKVKFDQISSLMLEAALQPEEQNPSSEGFISMYSEELFQEISRIYQIDEGREIMEKLQVDALDQLEVLKSNIGE